jgi:uncharacterized protein (DUF2252 family)
VIAAQSCRGIILDIVKAIRAFNAGREPQRLAIKYARMRSDPFVFLRGTCHLFYARKLPGVLFKKAPLAWISGDLHLENFGAYKGDNRLAYFDANDFDEAALAPASWEVVRFLASLMTAGETLAIGAKKIRRLCATFSDSYASTLAAGHIGWLERETARGLIRDMLDELRASKRIDLLNRHTERKGQRRQIRCDGDHAIAPSADGRRLAVALMEKYVATNHARQGDRAQFFQVVDVANRVAGTGSLGLDRWLVLVEGKGAPDGHYLLDLKQAVPSSLAPRLAVAQPDWRSQADRIASLQRRLQAVPIAFLAPIKQGRRSYLLRGLQASVERLSLAPKLRDVDDICQAITDMGRLVAWAQLRAAGRQGSAPADDLMAFGAASRDWQDDLLSVAAAKTAEVMADWQVYQAAYDAGALTQL